MSLDVPTIDDLFRRATILQRVGDSYLRENIGPILQAAFHSDFFRSELDEYFVPAESGCYTRSLVRNETENTVGLIAMEWGPGIKTPFHGHNNSLCAEVVIEGQLCITDAKPVRIGVLDHIGYSQKVVNIEVLRNNQGRRTSEVSPGDVAVVREDTDTHAVESKERSRSLHVYAVNKGSAIMYRPIPGNLWVEELCELRNDMCNGRNFPF
jgi:predicted metal-dependent enzyme (double-stranded beta helix superfamily)